MAAAHGGQILLSTTTYNLVNDLLPEGVNLHDLGEHHLKDLQRPERIYQVVVPGLPAGFPPLKTLDNRPNNLPPQRSPFVGREKEVAAISKELLREDVGVLTMTGPGGVGKTRLALQVAADLLDDFAAVCLWIQIWFLWRPNLPDEGDNHVAELAIAGNAAALVTFNVKDFLPAKFAAAGMKVLTPAQFKRNYLL